MKKKLMLFVSLFLVVIGGLITMFFLFQKPTEPNIGIFNLTAYEWEIQNFSTTYNVGKVDDIGVATEKAMSLWLENYNLNITSENLQVEYDPQEECWHIYSIASPNTLGGVSHAIIRQNGDVVAVWLDD